MQKRCLYLHQMNVDTTTAAGKLFFHVIAGFADDVERGIMQSHTAKVAA